MLRKITGKEEESEEVMDYCNILLDHSMRK
jgi:hypothetical protein